MITIDSLKKLRSNENFRGFEGIDGPTPIYLCKEKIDLININYSDPNKKWLFPAAGHGTYAIIVYWKYMKGLSEIFIDDNERSRHILNNMLYLNEINPWLCRQLRKQGFINVIEGDYISYDFKMKFDVVIGNPPYQEVSNNGKSKGGGKGGANNLWSKFFIKSSEISDNVFFIHPPSFLTPNHKVFEKMFDDGGLKLLKIFDKSPFQGVGTQSCYYYWSRGYKGLCSMEDKMVNLNDRFLPNSSNPIDFSIFNKFFKNKDKLNFVSNSKLHKTNKKDLLSENYSQEFNYKTYHGSNIIYSSVRTEWYPILKVIISDSGYLNPILDSNCNTTQHNFFMEIDTQEQGNNLVDLLNSKIYNYCLNKSKFSGFFHGEVLKNIPKVDINKKWSDSELYEFFGLTEDEIIQIETNAK